MTRREFISSSSAFLAAHALGKGVDTKEVAVGCEMDMSRGLYASNGIIAMWDGEWNVGWGVHDSSSLTVKELISGKTENVRTIGDNYFTLRTNYGYDTNYGPRPSEVTIEFCGCKHGSMWGHNGNPTYPSIFACAGNSAGYYGAQAFSASAPWVTSGWLDWNRAYTSVSTIRISCDGTTTTISVGDGSSKRSFARGFGTIDRIGFCTGTKSTGFSDIIHSIRIYDRMLTAEEIAHNYAVDKARFKLP